MPDNLGVSAEKRERRPGGTRPDNPELLQEIRQAMGGNFVDIGPEAFASEDGSVICWKGRNYVPQDGKG